MPPLLDDGRAGIRRTDLARNMMMLKSVVSVATVALVIARAVDAFD